jgi:hypothetical protein
MGDDEQEAEGLSIADVDALEAKAKAWDAISEALDENAQDHCSAADVCAVGFYQQEQLAKGGPNGHHA